MSLPSFEPRSLVNAGMLRQFAGKNVSIMLRVDDITEGGKNLNATSTDKESIRVRLPDDALDARQGNWVEIIGTPAGSDAIRAKEVIQFGAEDFDEEGYNMMVQFMNNGKEIFRTG